MKIEQGNERENDDMPMKFIKIMGAYITLEMALESAIDVLEKSYGADTPHIREGIGRLYEGLEKAKGILDIK